MKISSNLIAICLLLGAENAVKATALSSDAIAEIMSFNQIPMQNQGTIGPAASGPTEEEGPKIVIKPVTNNKVVSPVPVPPEAAAKGAVVVEEKESVTTPEEANKPPVEETEAPGEEEAKAKPQPKGDAVQLKPKTVVVKEANGEEVVTVPSHQVKPVVVEKAVPVVLKKDVDLAGDKLKDELDVQNKVKSMETEKAMTTEELVRRASLATAGDVSDLNDQNNQSFQSGMTLYHWKMYDQDTQLDMYKASVYKGNMFEDLSQKARVAIKLTEEETQKVQSTLAKKLAEIKELAQQVIGSVNHSELSPQEKKVHEDLKKRGFSKHLNNLQDVPTTV